MSTTAPEPYVAVALYYEGQRAAAGPDGSALSPAALQTLKEKAHMYVDRALEIDGKHVPALLVKGFICLSTGDNTEAVSVRNLRAGSSVLTDTSSAIDKRVNWSAGNCLPFR